MAVGTLQAFNWTDYVIIAIVVISTLISLIRGFVRETLSLITWVVAFIVGFKFCDKLAVIFVNYIQTPTLRLLLGFVIIFLITLILGGLLGFLISSLVVKTGLSGTDRTLGMVFGFIRGVLVIAILLLIISMGGTTTPDWWRESYLVPHFQSLVNFLHGFLPEKIANFSHLAVTTAAQKSAAVTISS